MYNYLTDKDLYGQTFWTTDEYRRRLSSISRLNGWVEIMPGITPIKVDKICGAWVKSEGKPENDRKAQIAKNNRALIEKKQ